MIDTPDAREASLAQRLQQTIDFRLNDYLCEMKPNFDDSITGFNEAWDIVRAVFAEPWAGEDQFALGREAGLREAGAWHEKREAQYNDLLHFQNALVEAFNMPEDIEAKEMLLWFLDQAARRRNVMKNLLFPGRPDYTGPTTGLFGLLHHELLCESSRDVMGRVDYVKREKPKGEVAIRLHNMIYLGDCEAATRRAALDVDYKARIAALYADYYAKLDTIVDDYGTKREALIFDYNAKRDVLDADYNAKLDALSAEILTYIKSHIPDCAWNGKELVFVDGESA